MAGGTRNDGDGQSSQRLLKASMLVLALVMVGLALVKGDGKPTRAGFADIGEAHAKTPLRALARSELGRELAEEYRAIRPADLDGAVPPIPPSELWPAQ